MKIKVEQVLPKGLELTEALKSSFLNEALTAAPGFTLAAAGALSARFERVGTDVLVKAAFECALSTPCRRCVEPVNFTLPVKFELNLVPESRFSSADVEGEDDGGSERAGTFAFEDAESEPFDGKRIDMDPIVREQLLLALPASMLCKEDCRGLCTVCGQNLNEKECGCERKPVDVRLLKLKDIKLQS